MQVSGPREIPGHRPFAKSPKRDRVHEIGHAEAMDGWTCPDCGRRFGRNRQSHACQPGMSIEEYFSTGPAHEKPIADAVLKHLESVGPVHVDAVSVGLFLKNPRKFAELRPMTKWVALSFSLTRRASHRTILRKVMPYGGRYYHVANLATPADFDDELRDLLTEAYELARAGTR